MFGTIFRSAQVRIRITAPPEFNTFLIVGIAALIRVLSVISNLSFNGTLKSTLIMTFLFVKIECIYIFHNNTLCVCIFDRIITKLINNCHEGTEEMSFLVYSVLGFV